MEIGEINTSKRIAKCEECRKEISKETLRISATSHYGNYPTNNHYHLKCYLKILEEEIERRKNLLKEILKHKKEIVIEEL